MQVEEFHQTMRKLQRIRGSMIFLESSPERISDEQLRVIDLTGQIFRGHIAELAELRDASLRDEPETARQMAALIHQLEELSALVREIKKSVSFLKADQTSKGEN